MARGENIDDMSLLTSRGVSIGNVEQWCVHIVVYFASLFVSQAVWLPDAILSLLSLSIDMFVSLLFPQGNSNGWLALGSLN